MNDGSTIRDRGRNREEVELFCYKVLTLLVKWYSVIVSGLRLVVNVYCELYGNQ